MRWPSVRPRHCPGLTGGSLVEESEAEIEFINCIFAFAFCPCDGSRNFPAKATQFRCGPFVVILGFLISRSIRLFDASSCVVEVT